MAREERGKSGEKEVKLQWLERELERKKERLKTDLEQRVRKREERKS